MYGVLHRDSGVPFEDVWEQHWRGVQRKAEKADARLENRRQTVSLGAFCDEPGLYYAYMTREVVMNSMLIARSRNHQVQTMGQAVRESQAVGGKAHDRKDYPWVAEETHLSDMVNLKAFGEDYEEDPTDNDTAQKRANRKLLAEISAASRSGDTNQLDVTSVLTRAQDLVALHPQADTRHIVVQDAVPGTSATCINESKALMRPRPPGREARPPRPPGLPKKNFFFRHHKIFHQKKKKNFFLGAGDFGKKKSKKKKSKKNHHRRSSSDVSKIHIFLPNFAKYPKIFPKEKKKKKFRRCHRKKNFFFGRPGGLGGRASRPGGLGLIRALMRVMRRR